MALLFLLCRYADENAIHHQEGRGLVSEGVGTYVAISRGLEMFRIRIFERKLKLP